jgi:hypothetical protein
MLALENSAEKFSLKRAKNPRPPFAAIEAGRFQ